MFEHPFFKSYDGIVPLELSDKEFDIFLAGMECQQETNKYYISDILKRNERLKTTCWYLFGAFLGAILAIVINL